MTELKNVEQELSRFNTRLLAAGAFVLFGFGLLGARLVHLQIVKHQELATQAENNRIAVVPIVPNRGLIVDRNGVVLANNYSAYTLEITPSKAGELEPLIDRLAEVVEIQTRDRKRLKRLLEESKSFESLPIRTKLTDEEVARFTAQRFRFPGVDIKARLFRNYPLGEVGSHLLGYIGRINQAEKEAIEETEDAANYRGTEYIGKLGIGMAFGLGVVAAAYGIGSISGAHLNPAVSIGMVTAGRMSVGDFIGYVVAQVIGAILAIIVIKIMGTPGGGLGETTVGATGTTAAFIFEAVATFLFVTVILGATASNGGAGALAGGSGRCHTRRSRRVADDGQTACCARRAAARFSAAVDRGHRT